MGIKCVDIDVDRRGINPLKDAILILRYFLLVLIERPVFVITYSIKPNIYAGMVCSLLNVPYFVNVQGLGAAFENPKLKPLVIRMYKLALKKARVTFFENEGNKELFLKEGIVDASKVYVTKGAGINVSQYPYKYYPDNDIFRFLYVGRIMKEKGIDELFEAIEMLEKDGLEFVLDIVGFFEDEYKDKVEELVKRGLVEYHGFKKDPKPYYADADCVVLPSYHEGLSNVLLEGACTGRPLLTSNIDGCREALLNNISGFLFEPRNAKSLYEAMKKMMNTSFDDRELMGEMGHRYVCSKFDRRDVIDKVLGQIGK